MSLPRPWSSSTNSSRNSAPTIIYLIQRSIGLGSKSLKGRPVDLLQAGARHRFFPDLWDIRCDMTDRWGSQYGVVRDSISKHDDAAE